MSAHYRRGNPEAGCGCIMLASGLFTLSLYVGAFILFGWRGPLTLLLISVGLGGIVGILIGLSDGKPLPPRTW